MKSKYRFTAKIQRDCFHRSLTGSIEGISSISNLLRCASTMVIENDVGFENLDVVTIRLTRVKPRTKKP